jgi:hypothetical protein
MRHVDYRGCKIRRSQPAPQTCFKTAYAEKAIVHSGRFPQIIMHHGNTPIFRYAGIRACLYTA